jgi:hypothetical protein
MCSGIAICSETTLMMMLMMRLRVFWNNTSRLLRNCGMITLSKEQIMRLHKKLFDNTGWVEGLRDGGLLDFAILKY